MKKWKSDANIAKHIVHVHQARGGHKNNFFCFCLLTVLFFFQFEICRFSVLARKPPFTTDQLRRYIRFARTVKPFLTPAAEKLLVNCVCFSRFCFGSPTALRVDWSLSTIETSWRGVRWQNSVQDYCASIRVVGAIVRGFGSFAPGSGGCCKCCACVWQMFLTSMVLVCRWNRIMSMKQLVCWENLLFMLNLRLVALCLIKRII